MAELELPNGEPVLVFWIHDHPKEEEHLLVKEGPLTSVVDAGVGKLKEGSLLFGEMKIIEPDELSGAARGLVRYTLTQLPNGKKYPVCIETILQGDPKPGAIESSQPHWAGVWERWRVRW